MVDGLRNGSFAGAQLSKEDAGLGACYSMRDAGSNEGVVRNVRAM